MTVEDLTEIMERNHDYTFAPEKAIELGILDSIDSKTDAEKMAQKLYHGEEVEETEEVAIEKPKKDKKAQILELLSEMIDND